MIHDDLRLGIDLGIGSCGWAVIRYFGAEDARKGEIVAMGARTFDVPETDKERTPTNQLRRTARGMRRVLKRRRRRMGEVRRLFTGAGLIEASGPDALKRADLDPWTLRAHGLERRLDGPELAVALGHIAKHRGFKSNSKRDRGANAPDDNRKMLAAIARNQDKMGPYRTVGEMFARDEAFAGRKRNRDGNFDHSVLRDDQAAEVRRLFAEQRRLGNTLATADLERAFADAAFFQRPLRDSDDLVGPCPLEQGEKRAAKRAPSFERFRFLQRLTSIQVDRDGPKLNGNEIARAEAEFGKTKKFTWRALRKLLDLGDNTRFTGVALLDESRDFVARSGNAAEGTASLREAIITGAGEIAWQSLVTSTPEKLDAAAALLTFRDDLDSIRKGLTDLGLDEPVLSALMKGVEDGKSFAQFKGAGHVSAKACRKLIPFLREGLVYSEACARAEYDHAAQPRTRIEDVNNPIAKKALLEGFKQVKAMVAEWGLPDAIHVELARDVGKSKEERDDISRGIDKRTAEKKRLRDEFKDTVGVEPNGPEDLLRFELWKEQRGKCFYTESNIDGKVDSTIDVHSIVTSDNRVQVDHILPWSKSGDDSFINKTLCLASANQEKKGCTPFEWFGTDTARWDRFVATVEGVKGMKGRKKRNYLLKDVSILEKKFKPRNLNDTRYACRLLLQALRDLYPKNDYRADDDGVPHKVTRVYSRPGPLTDRLRRAWGIQGLKKDENGNRIRDDRHHALDALIVAATTNSALNRLTLEFQKAEAIGSHRDFSGFEPPWPHFVKDARKWMGDDENGSPMILVSRAERRRARGEAHGATIRAIGEHEGREVVYERKAVDKLTAKDLDLIKDPERNKEIIAELRRWIEAGKPGSARPVKRFGGKSEEPRTEQIRKVSVRSNKKVDVLVRDGAADRGEMTRVDVFRKKNKRSVFEYFLVPIYPHQIFDAEGWPEPPNRAVQAYKPETEWPEMTEEHEFVWSFYPLSFIEVDLKTEKFVGYFRGLDRSTGAISLSRHASKDDLIRGIGAKTAVAIRKFAVDRLGRRFEVERETRSWRGAACT